MASSFLSRLIAAGLLLQAAGCRGEPSSTAEPDSWTDHHDPSGFTVRCPTGWTARGGADGRVVVRSATGSAFAAAQPFRANGMSAEQAIEREVKELASLLPAASVSRSEPVGGDTDEALASVSYTTNGKPGRACVLSCVYGDAGMFYVIGAVRDRYATERSVLISVLRSLKYTGTAANGASAAAPTTGAITYVSWTDPLENAFTTQVPRGWKVTGGLFRYAPVDVRPQVDAGSPDGTIHIRSGDAALGTFAPPGPSSQVRGLREGQAYQVNGVTYTVMHQMNASEFSRAFIQARVAKEHPGLQIGETKDRSELAETLDRQAIAKGMRPHDSWAETDFSFTSNGREYRGVCLAQTVTIGQGMGAIWTAFPSVVTAPADSLTTGVNVMLHGLESTTENPEWSARAQRDAAEFSQKVMQNHAAAMAKLHDIYQRFTQRMAENQRQWSNVINNEADVRNPSTGEAFKVAAGHNYYWQRGSTVVGTNTANPPDVDVTLLAKF